MSLKSILKRAQVWDASFDEIDNFRDLNHLIHIIIDRARKILPESNFHFFIHSEANKAYREEIKDDIATIDERNLIITYMSLRNDIVYKKNLVEENIFAEDSFTENLLFNKLSLDVFVPFVHSFKLLGFLGVGFNDDSKDRFSHDERAKIHELQKESILNLNAALLVDKRFAELMVLADLGKEISAKDEVNDLCDFLFQSISRVVDFDGGVLFLYDQKKEKLFSKSVYNIDESRVPEELHLGKSISGMVGKGKKPLLIKKLADNRSFQAKNKEEYLDGSIISIPLKTKNNLIGVLTIFSEQDHGEFTGENLHLLTIFGNFASTSLENLRLLDELERSYFETVSALVGALDASDPYTRGHSDRVMLFSEAIAKELDVPKEEVKMIKFGALLHDIGKIGISGDIIRKPARLTEEEYQIITEHPVIGGNILSGVEFLKQARQIVMYHHERLDGKGYPYNLTGKEIPLGVRILQVADVYDALSSDRPYREALTPDTALDIMIKDIGTHFDLTVIEAFINYLISENQLDENYHIPKKYYKMEIEKWEKIL